MNVLKRRHLHFFKELSLFEYSCCLGLKQPWIKKKDWSNTCGVNRNNFWLRWGFDLKSEYSKAGTVEIKVRATLQSEMASNKGLNPVVQFTDLSRIPKRQKFLCKYHTGEVLCRTGQVIFYVSSQEVWGGMGRQRNKELHWARQLPFLLFSKEDRGKKRTKKREKRNKPLPAERRPSFSHYCGSLAVV